MSNDPRTPHERLLHEQWQRQQADMHERGVPTEPPNAVSTDDDLPFEYRACVVTAQARRKGHSTDSGWKQTPYPCPYCATAAR